MDIIKFVNQEFEKYLTTAQLFLDYKTEDRLKLEIAFKAGFSSGMSWATDRIRQPEVE